MTPQARVAAAIDLVEEIAAAPRRPADAVANEYFRARRFIGSGDRRSVSDRAWSVLRARRRLGWWLARVDMPESPRMLVAASLMLEGWALSGVEQMYVGGKFGPAPLDDGERAALAALEGRAMAPPDMPIAVRLEVPDWIYPRLVTRFGDALEAEMDAMALAAPLDLRVNILKGTRADAISALALEGIAALPTPLSPWGLRVEGRRPVSTGAAFQSGLVEIQDEGSQLVAAIVGAAPGMRVADWCAGAGGKTLAMAMTMNNSGHIAACDVHSKRLDGAVARLRRAGVHNVERHLVERGDKWAKRRAGTFDRVLVDAPCTGTGTWRRNPDARTRLVEQDVLELVPKQADILDHAAKLVRVGGWLVYATCSVLRDENEDQVSAFLARHPEFATRPMSAAWALPGALPCPDPFLSLTPLSHRTDGFFAAILERVA